MKLEKRQKYAIRKLSVGVASVLAAQFYVGSVSDVPEVQAGEVVAAEIANQVDNVSAGKPKDIKDEVIGKKQDSTVENSTSVETKPKSEENPNSANLETPKKPEEKADKDTTDKVGSKEKEAEKSIEEKEKTLEEKEDKKSLDKKEVQEAKDTLSNRLLESKAVSQEAEKYLAGKEVGAEVRTKLTTNLESAKQEESKAQQLLTKDKATLEELNNSVRTLETALEVLYLELRRAGHSGKVSYRLETTMPANEAPYMTLERYFGDESDRSIRDYKLKKDGSTVELKYKVGLTRIDWDDVELTPDAIALGFTFDKNAGYLTKTVTLNNSLESRNYAIGVQSKANPSTRVVANLTIEEPPVFKVVEDYVVSPIKNNSYGDSVTYDSKTNTAYMTATPFGYYLESSKPQTIADATPNSPQYTSNLWLSLPGSRNEYNIVNNVAPITITKLEQTGAAAV